MLKGIKMAKSTIDELKAFITIVESGSINAAADRRDVTTSALSRTLQKLEKKLGVTLLERTTRKLNLTHEGEQFLTKARTIINELECAEEELLQFDQDIAGVIRIDSATPFVLHVLVPLIQEFQTLYPAIEIEINSTDFNIDLLEQNTDIAIRFGKLQASTLHAKRLCQTRLILVASPDYLAEYGTPTTPNDLLAHQLIGFSKVLSLNTWCVAVDGALLQVNPKLKASSGETVRQLALQGNGIACLSLLIVGSDIENGQLIPVLEDFNQPIYQDIHAIYYQQNHLPKRIRVFMDFLSQRFDPKNIGIN